MKTKIDGLFGLGGGVSAWEDGSAEFESDIDRDNYFFKDEGLLRSGYKDNDDYFENTFIEDMDDIQVIDNGLIPIDTLTQEQKIAKFNRMKNNEGLIQEKKPIAKITSPQDVYNEPEFDDNLGFPIKEPEFEDDELGFTDADKRARVKAKSDEVLRKMRHGDDANALADREIAKNRLKRDLNPSKRDLDRKRGFAIPITYKENNDGTITATHPSGRVETKDARYKGQLDEYNRKAEAFNRTVKGGEGERAFRDQLGKAKTLGDLDKIDDQLKKYEGKFHKSSNYDKLIKVMKRKRADISLTNTKIEDAKRYNTEIKNLETQLRQAENKDNSKLVEKIESKIKNKKIEKTKALAREPAYVASDKKAAKVKKDNKTYQDMIKTFKFKLNPERDKIVKEGIRKGATRSQVIQLLKDHNAKLATLKAEAEAKAEAKASEKPEEEKEPRALSKDLSAAKRRVSEEAGILGGFLGESLDSLGLLASEGLDYLTN